MKLQSRLFILFLLGLLSVPAVADGVKGTLRTIDYSTTNGDLQFQLNKAGVMTTVMYLKGSNSKVGIGTSAPGQNLEVVGIESAATNSGTTPDGVARFQPLGTNQTLDFGGTGTNAHAWIQSRNKTNFATALPLALNPTGGNVGIGTPVPTQTLDVNGSAIFRDAGSVSAPTISFSTTDTDTGIYHSSANQIDFTSNGTNLFSVIGGGVRVRAVNDPNNPGYSFFGDSDTGVYSSGAGKVDVTVNNDEMFQVNTGGISIDSGGTFKVQIVNLGTSSATSGSITAASGLTGSETILSVVGTLTKNVAGGFSVSSGFDNGGTDVIAYFDGSNGDVSVNWDGFSSAKTIRAVIMYQ